MLDGVHLRDDEPGASNYSFVSFLGQLGIETMSLDHNLCCDLKQYVPRIRETYFLALYLDSSALIQTCISPLPISTEPQNSLDQISSRRLTTTLEHPTILVFDVQGRQRKTQ